MPVIAVVSMLCVCVALYLVFTNMSPALLVIHGILKILYCILHIILQVMNYEITLTNQIEAKCDIQSKRYERVYLNPAPIDTDLFS